MNINNLPKHERMPLFRKVEELRATINDRQQTIECELAIIARHKLVLEQAEKELAKLYSEYKGLDKGPNFATLAP